MLYFIIDHKTT